MENRTLPNVRWFTLVELLISITLLIMVLGIAYWFILNLMSKSQEIAIRARAIAEMQSLNTRLSGIIKNSYWIDYENTKVSDDGGVISLYTDKQEKNKAKISIVKDEGKDISRVSVQYNSNPPQALNSSALFVTKLNVSTSPNPKTNPWVLEDQPWISVEAEGRSRSILEIPTDDEYLSLYEKVKTNLYGRWVLRNYVPSSLKQ